LHLGSSSDTLGKLNLGGNMTRQQEQDMPVTDDSSHVVNVGKMVEEMESKMRGMLSEVYFGKARDVIGDLRSMIHPSLCEPEADLKRHCSTDGNKSRPGGAARDDLGVEEGIDLRCYCD
jgi:capping protein beta